MATRTIIYCQTINQCAVVYLTLKTLIKFMLTHRTKIQKEWFLKCYILAAPSEIKISFLGHFSVMSKDTSIFLLRQNCNWYGVDCKKVHWTIRYFGSAKNVEKQKGSL